jgi:hypothetical protein
MNTLNTNPDITNPRPQTNTASTSTQTTSESKQDSIKNKYKDGSVYSVTGGNSSVFFVTTGKTDAEKKESMLKMLRFNHLISGKSAENIPGEADADFILQQGNIDFGSNVTPTKRP